MVPQGTPKGNPNKSSGLPIWETVYIFEINGARKVKSDAQVAINKNSDHTEFFSYGWLRDSALY